jgi:hypothetical protein
LFIQIDSRPQGTTLKITQANEDACITLSDTRGLNSLRSQRYLLRWKIYDAIGNVMRLIGLNRYKAA